MYIADRSTEVVEAGDPERKLSLSLRIPLPKCGDQSNNTFASAITANNLPELPFSLFRPSKQI